MRREDIVDISKRIPLVDHPKIQFILRTGIQLNVDIFVRFEPTYVVFRGRESGNVDEGRAFFMPYEEVVTMKIERTVKLGEIKKMYGEDPGEDEDEKFLGKDAGKDLAKDGKSKPLAATPAPNAPLDPAQIAKNNILARIRAARTAAGVSENR